MPTFDIFKLIAEGAVGVSVIVTIIIFMRERRIENQQTQVAMRQMQHDYLESIKQVSDQAWEDRRLFQDQLGKTVDSVIGVTHENAVALVEMKNALRSLETTVNEIRGQK